MKTLINPKTKEVAIIDTYFNTIHFSNSNTTHKAIIHKDPNTNKISKITTSPIPISEPINDPILNNTPNSSNNSTPNNTPIPNTNNNSNLNTQNNTINNNSIPNPTPSLSSPKTIILPSFRSPYHSYHHSDIIHTYTQLQLNNSPINIPHIIPPSKSLLLILSHNHSPPSFTHIQLFLNQY